MSSAIKSYGVIHNNPFIFAPIFVEFYRGCILKEKSLLLSYLVLPIVLPKESRGFLSRAKSTSTVATLLRHREYLEGLEERISEYRDLTNQAIRYAVDAGMIRIEADLSVKVICDECDYSLSPLAAPRAARRLGTLFEPYDIPTIYRTFGVKKL